MLTLPGLIDPHVHLRSLGQDNKEDFLSGTQAALAGGFTTVLDMPNNTDPITTKDRIETKIAAAREQIVCNVGFYFGSQGDNLTEFDHVTNNVLGLKLYLNKTTGNFLVNTSYLEKIFATWTKDKPILLHAIDESIDEVIHALEKHPRQIHICHISSEYELSKVMKAKEKNLPVTCGVTPHHLFLTEEDANHIGPYAIMQPPLRKRSDVQFLWKNIAAIDCVESDHAPHTREEKEQKPTPFGIPGLETTLPLLLTAVAEEKLSLDELVRLCHDGPKKIFLRGVTQSETTIEIDEKKEWEIDSSMFFSKAKWSPFNGWKIRGKLKSVKRGNTILFENGEIKTPPGSGTVLNS